MVGRNHTLPIVKGVMMVNKADGVTARISGFQEKRRELGEELFTSEASGCKVLVEARVGDANEREIVIGVNIETHDGDREEDIDWSIEWWYRLKELGRMFRWGSIDMLTFCQAYMS